MIELQHITQRYRTPEGRDFFALNDVSLSIKSGEIFGIIGRSGAGKSTLVRCINFLNRPTEGTVTVDGKCLNTMTNAELRAARRQIAMIFQHFNILSSRTVYDNAAFPLELAGWDKTEIRKKVEPLLDLVGLADHRNKYPSQLSGGQKQRVALARALVTEPRILLLDEPLSALDARIRRNLREQIRSIQKDLHLTTVFVTHDQEEAMTVSDRIFLMNRGAIVQQGTPEEVYLNPADEFAARFIGSYNLLTKAEAKVLLEFDSPEDLVAVRPESVFVREEGGKYPETCSEPVDGRVVSHQLLGNVIRYRIAAADTVLTVDVMNRSSTRLYAPESAVKLLFNLAELRPLAAQTQH